MFVTYKPDSGDNQTWTFNAGRVRASQAEKIEELFGGPWDQWKVMVQAGNMKARRVLLWHLLSTDHPTFRWQNTPDFFADELLVEHSVAELKEIVDKAAKAKLRPDQREAFEAMIESEMAEAEAREQVEAEGKAH